MHGCTIQWVQLRLSFWSVLIQMALGFLFALLLNVNSRLLEALRTIFLIPMVLPPIVVAIIWKVLYTPDISPFHWAAEGFGLTVPSLITNPNWALTAIVIADIWQWFPFVMLMILAALQMIPEEHVEAAKIDGASIWQMTVYVTLPYLKNVLLVAALFRLVDSIKAFPLIYILTDGGPGGDRGDELLLLHPGVQFLLSWLFQRDHRDAGRGDRDRELGDHPPGRLGEGD